MEFVKKLLWRKDRQEEQNERALDLEEVIFSYPLLAKRLEERPAEKSKVPKLIKEIASQFSPSAINTLKKTLDKTFAKLYDGISFESPPGLDIPTLVKNNKVVLVPNHQSHADYIALNYVIFTNFGIPVFVAGGINLNVFPIGTLFRKCGCFFIRRKFTSDMLYKLTLEAYLYYLLKQGHLIEFFFEGGRSRTGKLLPPRYGLFQMLIEANSFTNDGKPLLFVPVSIVHEVVPEQRAHVLELGGSAKKAESTAQLLKIFKIFTKKMGTIHIKLNYPLELPVTEKLDLKKTTQDMALDCFRAVGKGMPVTPSALLAFCLLDEPSGSLTWVGIKNTATSIHSYCKTFGIPLAPSLDRDSWEESLKRALEILILNRKMNIIKKDKLNQTFYAFKDDARAEILYFKNTILHHFLTPYFTCAAIIDLFQGRAKNASDLRKCYQTKRRQLKFEFYLPTIKEILQLGLRIVSDSVGREINDLDECFKLSETELDLVAARVAVFASALSYIYEGHFIAAMSVRHFAKRGFQMESFYKAGYEIFEIEREHGRIVKYPESYSWPLMKNSLQYFIHQKLVVLEDGRYKIADLKGLDKIIESYIRDLTDFVTFKIKYRKGLPNVV